MNEQSIVNACKLVSYDVWARNPREATRSKGPDKIDPDQETIQNIKIVLEKAGYLGFDNIVKSTVYLADMSDFGKMNTIYSKYFSDNAIASRSTVGVSLVGEYRIEIEIIAHK